MLVHESENVENKDVVEMRQYLGKLILRRKDYPTLSERKIHIYEDGVAKDNGYVRRIPQALAGHLIDTFLALGPPPRMWTYGLPLTHGYYEYSLELNSGGNGRENGDYGESDEPVKYTFINTLEGTGHMELATTIEDLFP